MTCMICNQPSETGFGLINPQTNERRIFCMDCGRAIANGYMEAIALLAMNDIREILGMPQQPQTGDDFTPDDGTDTADAIASALFGGM